MTFERFQVYYLGWKHNVFSSWRRQSKCFMLVFPHNLELLFEAWRHHDVDVVGGDALVEFESARLCFWSSAAEDLGREVLRLELHNHQLGVVRKEHEARDVITLLLVYFTQKWGVCLFLQEFLFTRSASSSFTLQFVLINNWLATHKEALQESLSRVYFACLLQLFVVLKVMHTHCFQLVNLTIKFKGHKLEFGQHYYYHILVDAWLSHCYDFWNLRSMQSVLGYHNELVVVDLVDLDGVVGSENAQLLDIFALVIWHKVSPDCLTYWRAVF